MSYGHSRYAPASTTLQPDLIAEIDRLTAEAHSSEGQTEFAAWSRIARDDPAERAASEAWESIADTAGWQWKEAL
jgi:hypothetical protein